MVQQGGKTLFLKLATIAGEIDTVAKKGRNEHHGYNYVTEADLLQAVRAKLSAAGIAYFFSVVKVETREVNTVIQNKGEGVEPWSIIPAKAGAITEVMVEATFADSDSGETYTVVGVGAGQDAGDKGVYKALTGAQKYLLMKTFLIATGDDPEGDSKVDKANDSEGTVKATTKGKAEKSAATPTVAPSPTPVAAAPAKVEARAHGEDQSGEVDPMTLILPGGPFKGTAIGALNLEQTTLILNGDEAKGLKPMPEKNSWTAKVKKRHDYLVEFSKMPAPVQAAANELDLQLR